MTSTAKAAATAAQRTREQTIVDAWKAFLHDVTEARKMMPTDPGQLTFEHVDLTRVILGACGYHLDEIERHLPDSPRRGMLNDYYGDSEDSE